HGDLDLLERLKDRCVVVAASEEPRRLRGEDGMEQLVWQGARLLIRRYVGARFHLLAESRDEDPLALLAWLRRDEAFALQPHPPFHDHPSDSFHVPSWVAVERRSAWEREVVAVQLLVFLLGERVQMFENHCADVFGREPE